MSDNTFTPQMPHGDLEQVFADIYFVTGTARPNFSGEQWQFSRNMTVVRDGEMLTLINTVRLDDGGLAALDALGRVENVVRIGAFHGIDDAFYLDRYDAKQWALPGHVHEAGHPTDFELTADGPKPFSSCALFVFETADQPEGLLLIQRDDGILVSGDSLQNWAEVDEYFSEDSAQKMTAFGFIRPANIGPGWLRSANPDASDFERLKSLEFQHLLPGHGTPIRGSAHEALAATFAEAFGI